MLLGAIPAMLADEAFAMPYLVFQDGAGSSQSIAVESLEITFDGAELVAQNAEASIRLAVAQLDKMYFSASPAGVDHATAAPDSENVEVFSVFGVPMGRFGSIGEAERALGSGIYVVRTNGVTTKMAVR